MNINTLMYLYHTYIYIQVHVLAMSHWFWPFMGKAKNEFSPDAWTNQVVSCLRLVHKTLYALDGFWWHQSFQQLESCVNNIM